MDLLPVAAPGGDPQCLRGLRIGVVDDGQAIASALVAVLDALGAEPTVLNLAEPGFDGLVDLSALRTTTDPVLPDAFLGLRRR